MCKEHIDRLQLQRRIASKNVLFKDYYKSKEGINEASLQSVPMYYLNDKHTHKSYHAIEEFLKTFYILLFYDNVILSKD